MTNNYIRHAPYLRNRPSSDHNFWYTYVKWWYLQGVFSLLLNYEFLGCYEGKRVKNSPKWKITNLLCAIPKEQYSIWSWFMEHLYIYDDDISRVFFSFKNFWFFRSLVGKRAKTGPKWQKNLSLALHIWKTIYHKFPFKFLFVFTGM